MPGPPVQLESRRVFHHRLLGGSQQRDELLLGHLALVHLHTTQVERGRDVDVGTKSQLLALAPHASELQGRLGHSEGRGQLRVPQRAVATSAVPVADTALEAVYSTFSGAEMMLSRPRGDPDLARSGKAVDDEEPPCCSRCPGGRSLSAASWAGADTHGVSVDEAGSSPIARRGARSRQASTSGSVSRAASWAKRQVRGLLKSGASERKMSGSSTLGTSSKMSNCKPGAR